MTQFVRVGIALWILTGFRGEARPDAKTSWASKLDCSLVHDTNVFESLNARQSDEAARLLLSGSLKRRIVDSFRILACYRGGAEIYRRFSEENRAVNELTVEADVPVQSYGAVGLHIEERLKTYFRSSHGYAYTEGFPYLRCRLLPGFYGTVFYALSRLNYREGTYFDYRAWRAGLRLDCALTSWLVFSVQGFKGETRYPRQAFRYDDASSETEQWIALQQSQKDSFREWFLQCESTRWLFLRAGIGFEHNGSNNYGYAFRQPKIHLLVVKNIAADWTVSLFWTSQIKRYSDSLRPILQISPESENEENNFILIDLTKMFGENNSLRIQAGYYRNESPFRDLYYQKTLYSIGMTHTF